MGLFDIFNKRAKGSSIELPITYRSGGFTLSETNSTYLFCENAIANTIATMPLSLHFKNPKGGRLKAGFDYRYNLVKRNPNPDETASTFYDCMIKNILRKGNAYILKVKDEKGNIVALLNIPSNAVTVEMKPTGKIFIYEGNQYTSNEIIHIPSMYGYDGLVGKSIFQYANTNINNSNKMDNYLSNYYDNTLTSKIVVDIKSMFPDGATTEDRKSVQSWIEKIVSKENSGKPLVVAGEEIKELGSTNAKDSEMIANRNLQNMAICNILNVPYSLLSGENKYGSLEQFNILFYRTCILPWTTRIEEAFNKHLLSTYEQGAYYFAYNYDNLLKPDTTTRADVYCKYFNSGILSANQILEKEDMDSIGDEGDVYFISSGLMPLRMDVIDAYMAGAKLKQAELEKDSSSTKELGQDGLDNKAK